MAGQCPVTIENPKDRNRVKDRYAVIANENARWGAGRPKVYEVESLLRRYGLRFSVSTTCYPGHAKELAARAASEMVDAIIVVGGDGTVSEVVNGLMACGCDHMPQIGIVPSGSSNDFSKSLSIPQTPREACQVIKDGRVRSVDVGRVGPHYFCMASCLGYFADIAAKSLRMRGFSGSLRYTISAISVICRLSTGWAMTVKTDETVFKGRYGVLLVSSTPRFGGLTMMPGAKFDDGVLDCLLVETGSRLEALHMLSLVHRKSLENHRKAWRFQTTALSVSLDRVSRVCNDGEIPSELVQNIEYSVLARKLKVMC